MKNLNRIPALALAGVLAGCQGGSPQPSPSETASQTAPPLPSGITTTRIESPPPLQPDETVVPCTQLPRQFSYLEAGKWRMAYALGSPEPEIVGRLAITLVFVPPTEDAPGLHLSMDDSWDLRSQVVPDFTNSPESVLFQFDGTRYEVGVTADPNPDHPAGQFITWCVALRGN